LRATFVPGLQGYPLLGSLPLKLAREAADIIHGHCFYYCTGDISSVISRIRKIPFVFNPYFYVHSGRKGDFYKKTIGQLTMNADVTIVISKFEKELIEKAGMRVKRFELISPSIEVTEFGSVDVGVYDQFGIDLSETRVVLFVGRIDYGKGIDTLISAVPSVLKKEPEVTFFVVGPDWGDRSEFERQIESKKVGGNVVLAGPLSRQELISAYKGATMLAFPSRYEAFGIVLIEAMAAGLPIVASNASAIPYVIEQGENGLLFPLNDHECMARNILSLLRDENLMNGLRQNGYRLVKEKYDRKVNIDKLEEIYRSLLGVRLTNSKSDPAPQINRGEKVICSGVYKSEVS
jgi:glycosyltransferase involved in cell wall biosynthesis